MGLSDTVGVFCIGLSAPQCHLHDLAVGLTLGRHQGVSVNVHRGRYRTNVCRRRLASDLARASVGTPAQGALEDHHDLPPGSPPEKAGVTTQVVMLILIS